MLDCWKSDPGERPTFEKLVKVMRTLILMNKHQVSYIVCCTVRKNDVIMCKIIWYTTRRNGLVLVTEELVQA